jgi:uncharacterized membrane protein
VRDVLLALLVVDSGITAGSFVAVHFAVAPTMVRLVDESAVTFHGTFDHFIHRYMPVTAFSSMVIAIALLVGWTLSTADVVLIVVGALGILGAILISQFINVPMNRVIMSWDVSAIPSDYHAIRARWLRWDGIRTYCSLVAVACFTAAAVRL